MLFVLKPRATALGTRDRVRWREAFELVETQNTLIGGGQPADDQLGVRHRCALRKKREVLARRLLGQVARRAKGEVHVCHAVSARLP